MMLANFEWFRGSFASLSDDTQRTELLKDLKIAVGALNNDQVQFLSLNLPLKDVFDCLNSSDRNQVEVTCDVLELLLPPLDLDVLVTHYGAMLLRALGHPVTRVKEMVFRVLDRAASNDISLLRLSQEPELLAAITSCIVDAETSVGSAVVKLLVKLASNPAGLAAVYKQPDLKRIAEQDSVMRYRVYEAVVNISAASPRGLIASQPFLQPLLQEIEGHDPLGQLSAVKLLTDLALTPHGLAYLESTGLIDRMAQRVNKPDVEGYIVPGLLEFFGHLARARPQEVFQRYPDFVSALRRMVTSADMVLCNIAMETLGFVGTTLAGKCVLDHLDILPAVLRKLGVHIATLQTEWRVRALNIVADLMQLKEDGADETLTQRWFSMLADSPMETIAGVCRLPFPELRLAGLLVVQAIATQRWGQQALSALPGSVEFLTDRSQEPNKHCLDVKFEIVKSISESTHSENVFSVELLKRIKDFVKEGAYWAQSQTEVTIESLSV